MTEGNTLEFSPKLDITSLIGIGNAVIITDQIINLFFKNYKLIEIFENNSEFTCKYSVDLPFSPNIDVLNNVLDKIPKRDKISIYFIIDSMDDSFFKYTDKNSIDDFILEIKTKLSLAEDTNNFYIKVTIEKGRLSNESSIYSLSDMIKFWSKDGVPSAFKKLEELTNNVKSLRVYGLTSIAQTNCVAFTPFHDENKFVEQLDRNVLNTKRDKIGHFANAYQYNFVPEDFCFDVALDNPELNYLFDSLKLVSSLVYICDFAKFSNHGDIHLRLNGYRLFTKDILISEKIDLKSGNEYYDIYKWIYGEGNIIDKAGLSRNIISLHLEQDDLLKVKEKTLQSISSGYQIYLKDNVKQYIDIKNKLSEFIQSSSDKASEIVKNVGDYYKKSIWTMYTFFASVFLLKILSKVDDSKLVTDEIFFLFIAFSIISVIIMKYSLNELEEEKKRFEENYLSLKARYMDLLLPEDLNKILNDDSQHKCDVAYIDTKKESFSKLWDWSLSTIFFFIFLLWLAGKYSIGS